jgi:hypothetical protein
VKSDVDEAKSSAEVEEEEPQSAAVEAKGIYRLFFSAHFASRDYEAVPAPGKRANGRPDRDRWDDTFKFTSRSTVRNNGGDSGSAV